MSTRLKGRPLRRSPAKLSLADRRTHARVLRGDAHFHTGSDYVNQIGLETDEDSERIKAAYGANYEWLVAVKNKYDSTNLFRHNQNIKPTV